MTQRFVVMVEFKGGMKTTVCDRLKTFTKPAAERAIKRLKEDPELKAMYKDAHRFWIEPAVDEEEFIAEALSSGMKFQDEKDEVVVVRPRRRKA